MPRLARPPVVAFALLCACSGRVVGSGGEGEGSDSSSEGSEDSEGSEGSETESDPPSTPPDMPPPTAPTCPTGPVEPLDCGHNCLSWAEPVTWEQSHPHIAQGMEVGADGRVLVVGSGLELNMFEADASPLWQAQLESPGPDELGLAVSTSNEVWTGNLDWLNAVPTYYSFRSSPTGELLASRTDPGIEPYALTLLDDDHVVIGGRLDTRGFIELRDANLDTQWTVELDAPGVEEVSVRALASYEGRIYALVHDHNPSLVHVLAFDAAGEQLWAREFPEAESHFHTLHAGPCGPVAILGRQQMFAVAMDPAGETQWELPLRHDGDELIHYRDSLLRDNGELVVSGIIWGPVLDGNNTYPGIWARWDPTGDRRYEPIIEQLQADEEPDHIAAFGDQLYSFISLSGAGGEGPHNYLLRKQPL